MPKSWLTKGFDMKMTFGGLLFMLALVAAGALSIYGGLALFFT